MVILQNEPESPNMASRLTPRQKRDFDSNRALGFQIRSIRDMAKRPYWFESFRILHWDIIVEDAQNREEKAREFNVQGVKLFKDGKWDEAFWMFQKALSIFPGYENAQKNMATLNAKLETKKRKVEKDAKAGKSLKDASRDYDRDVKKGPQTVMESTGDQTAYVQDGAQREISQPQYPSYTQSTYQSTQPQRQSAPSPWTRNYRCPGCSIPVKENWVMCTNCGTDLRQYPPIPY